MRSLLVAALGAVSCLVACATPSETAAGSGEQDLLSDAVSIVRRPDGKFDVFCRGRDGAADYAQTVEASAIQDDSVCSPAAPPRPTVVAIANRDVTIAASSNNATIDQWGTDLWQGFATFDVQLASDQPSYPVSATLIDGSGASYPLSTAKTRYDRLPTPIKVVASSSYYGGRVIFTGSAVDVTKTLPTAAPKLATKYSATTTTTLKVLGTELPGAPITFTAGATFRKNFTNGNSCSRASLVDASGAATVLDPSAPSRRVTLKAPVTIQATSTCISSRLAAPESATADVEVELSRVEIGAAAPTP